MLASRKRHASSTWRAIMAGREALQHGLIKRVVDGNTTEIWRDRWIANHFDGRPITPQEGQVITTVSELLNANGDWNIETVRGCFFKIDAEAILRLPVGRGDHDVWAWDMEKSGIYSVKTAYKLLYKIKVEGAHPETPSSSSDDLWKVLWKIKVPPKVKVFWWRVIHEFLPAIKASVIQETY
jgi:hypothetical protein